MSDIDAARKGRIPAFEALRFILTEEVTRARALDARLGSFLAINSGIVTLVAAAALVRPTSAVVDLPVWAQYAYTGAAAIAGLAAAACIGALWPRAAEPLLGNDDLASLKAGSAQFSSASADVIEDAVSEEILRTRKRSAAKQKWATGAAVLTLLALGCAVLSVAALGLNTGS